jgi:hypothetical protein
LQALQYFRKGKDPEPDPDTHLWSIDPEPVPGGPKICGSGSPTLFVSVEHKKIGKNEVF